jgi:radical SAM protein with 4Fe4S-binding SPASM domain
LKKGLEKDLEKIQNDLKGVYGFEITTTEACNFNCRYCFERDHKPNEKTLTADVLIPKIKQLLESDWFKDQYCGIKLILWGGEPTLNMGLCTALMNEFSEDERVCFFIYTNGSTAYEMLPAYKQLKDKPFIKKEPKKLTVQISYDGNPLHDQNRVFRNGDPTSDTVYEAIALLHRMGIDYGLKATMAWDDFKHLPETWTDFKILHDQFGPKIKYALTVDYYNVQFSQYREEVEEALMKTAQKEIKFHQEYDYFLSNIFRNSQAICATGRSMAVINTNGDILNCHGSIYSKYSKDLTYASIFDEDFINSIERANELYKDNHIEPEVCQQCHATSCLRCNVKKYEESKKETHLEKWFDYPAQTDLCEYYRLVGKISAAIGSILRK